MKWIIAALALMLLVTACANQTEEPELKLIEEELVDNYQTIELRFIDEKFDPNTIVVDQGTTVRLIYMNTEPFELTLQEYGIAEKVGASHYAEFVADKKGTFSYECADCDPVATGLLKVI